MRSMKRQRIPVEHGIRKVDGLGYEVRIGGKSRTAKTLTEARTLRRQLDQERAEAGGGNLGAMTLRVYLKRWLEDIAKTRSAGTYSTWETVVRLRILPAPIARRKLRDLTPVDLKGWAFGLLSLEVSSRTVHKYVECLSAALHDAYAEGLVVRDLMRAVELPEAPPHEAMVYTPEQMRRFMAACAAEASRTSYALRLIAWTGCRSSEARNAVEGDVDLERGTWRIPRGKTRAAARTVKLRPEAVAMLAELIEQHRQAATAKWANTYMATPRWLFRNRIGTSLTGDGVRRGLRRIAKGVGLPPCRVHDLRHAFATHGLEAGVDRRVLGKVLGHANEAMTGFYQHASDGLQAAAVDAVVDSWTAQPGEVCPTCRRPGWIKETEDAG
jgi:integrase